MDLIDKLLLKLGLVRLKKYDMLVSRDGRLVSAPSTGSDWTPTLLPTAAAIDLLIPVTKAASAMPPIPRRVARGTHPPDVADAEIYPPAPMPATLASPPKAVTQDYASPSAPQNPMPPSPMPEAVDEEDWEWRLAMARAKATPTDEVTGSAPTAGQQDEEEDWAWKVAMARAKSDGPARPIAATSQRTTRVSQPAVKRPTATKRTTAVKRPIGDDTVRDVRPVEAKSRTAGRTSTAKSAVRKSSVRTTKKWPNADTVVNAKAVRAK